MPPALARRSLKPQLNQIRTWVRQGRTDAWIAHQLEVTVKEISTFKREHALVPSEGTNDEPQDLAAGEPDEFDLRAEDDALVAAELEAELGEDDDEIESDDEQVESGDELVSGEQQQRRRRRGRRGGRGRRRGGSRREALDGTFDHGEEGYGLWLDPSVQDNPVYAEHWAGHRPVTVSVEPDRIVITRAGGAGDGSDDEGE